jgi:hypothetical protein
MLKLADGFGFDLTDSLSVDGKAIADLCEYVCVVVGHSLEHAADLNAWDKWRNGSSP